MKTNSEIRQHVTDAVIAALQQGVSPWQRPWSGDVGMPRNCISGHEYRGCNVPYLMAVAATRGFATQQWLTFNQARNAGGSVRKGEKAAAYVVFVKPLIVKDKEDETKTRKILMLRSSAVFNIAQTDGVKLPAREVITAPAAKPDQVAISEAQAYLSKMGANWSEGGNAAYYSPTNDAIVLPDAESFRTGEGYAATAYHELVHWTGHASRTNRNLAGKFGSSDYAAEELVAELGSAMLCAKRGVASSMPNHASYIASWIKLLQSDNKHLFTASTLAEKAVNFLEGETESELLEKAA